MEGLTPFEIKHLLHGEQISITQLVHPIESTGS